MNKLNYIIYAPSYNEDSGGCIVLHKLCHMLNTLGENAFLWSSVPRKKGLFVKYRTRPYLINQLFNTPIANVNHLQNAVIIYPEVTSGNPLKGKNIIRWFLHKPGYHTGKINYGKNELYFFYDKASDDPIINIHPDNQLTIYSLNKEYRNLNYSERKGSCYLMRKGEGMCLVHDTNDSIKIDGLSHSEIAEIFNKTKYFYSYDEFTMYSQFSAISGCISVVIPSTYKTRSEWVEKHPIAKYGVAYGLNDIEHAKNSQHLLFEYFKRQEKDSIKTVYDFIDKSKDFFIK